jgi:hypothetical protein
MEDAPPPKPTSSEPPAKRRTSSAPRKSGVPRKPARVLLSEDEVSKAKATSETYDRARTYGVGDYFVHPKFGVGRVEEQTPEGFIMVLFEGGDTRRLLHARP